MTLLLIHIYFEISIFLSPKAERKKRGLRSYLSARGGDRRLCLKILPGQLEKRDKFMKNGSEGKDIFGDSRKRCRAVHHAKNWTALRTDNIVPTEKK